MFLFYILGDINTLQHWPDWTYILPRESAIGASALRMRCDFIMLECPIAQGLMAAGNLLQSTASAMRTGKDSSTAHENVRMSLPVPEDIFHVNA